MKNRKNIIFLAVLFFLGTSFIAWLTSHRGLGRYEYETQVVQKRQIPSISIPGTVISPGQVPLFFRADGIVTQVHVKPGDPVTKGTILASLDVNELDVTRYHYLSGLEEEIKKLHDPYKILNSINKLSKKGFYSDIDADDSRTQVLKVARDYIALQQALEDYDKRTEGKILRAPYDGVVAEMNLKVGDFVNAGRQLLPGASVFRPEDKLQVRLEVPDEMIGYLALGQEAKVWLPISRNNHVPGKVTVISPSVIVTERMRYFSAMIELEKTSQDWLKLGMRVMTDVQAKVEQPGVWIPRAAAEIDIPEDQISETVSFLTAETDLVSSRDRSESEIQGQAPLKQESGQRTISAVGRSYAVEATPEDKQTSSIVLMNPAGKLIRALVRIGATNQDQIFIPNAKLEGQRVVTHYRSTKSISRLLESGN
ncbi:MAG: efflux RND transporter periplasmic adaptor subunit [Bdellovibrionales bacterium]|nr:efflux RND transporter periplasmic adaptor subunit [Bdellovibrionales bacterium]